MSKIIVIKKPLFFSDGTSLSKMRKLTERFPEDIDFALFEIWKRRIVRRYKQYKAIKIPIH